MNEWLELLKVGNYLNVKKHLKNGADANESNELGESVLALAIRSGCNFDLLSLLMDGGADPFDFDEEGVSVFDMAITYDNLEMVNYLIQKGVNVSETNRRSGFTPLMAAACYGRIEIAKALIERGVDQNASDVKGFTAADFARKMNKKSVLKILDYDENDPRNVGYAR